MAKNKDQFNPVDAVAGVVMERIQEMAIEQAENAKTFAVEQQIMGNLAKLGGKMRDDDDIEYGGKKIVLPEGTTIGQNIKFLKKKLDELEKETTFTHVFNYRPWDGAYAMWNVLRETFGSVSHKDSMEKTFFGKKEAAPKMLSIPIGYEKKEQVAWGRFELVPFPGTLFEADEEHHPQKGPLFKLIVTGPKKFKYEIQGIFRLIEDQLEHHSMYRGKAFDGQTMPEFLNVHAVNREMVVYSNEVMKQLEAHIWAQLRHTAEVEKAGVPLKRAVLIHGPFGTGKTLACLLTAQEAVENGWTFIQARTGRDNLHEVLQTAKLYEPAVVFYEDIDMVANSDEEGIGKLLDDFDGIGAKGTKILMVLTTNYPEKIHKGMARPGRLDAMIEINELDQDGVEKLVRTRIQDSLDSDIDWGVVYESAREYKPAFVTEGADRTIRYLIARNGRMNGNKITTQDIVDAMDGLRSQYDLMTGAKDQPERIALDVALKRTMSEAIQQHRVDFSQQGDILPVPAEDAE